MAIDYKNLPKGSFEEAARELLRRSKLKNELADPAFKQQDQLVKIKDQFVSATCTRRAGKSYGLGLKLINTARKWDNSISPYVGLTRKSCENIMWPVLKDINNRFGVGITFKDSDLEASLPNGSKISLFGADQKNFIDRLRGPKYPIFVIDEAQSFRSHIEELVDDVATPATGDYVGGQIVLTGTPGPVPKGFFYEASIGKHGFTPIRWTVYDNPYFPNPTEFVEKLFAKKGWTRENPTYRREWLGEWVADTEALVYRFRDPLNTIAFLPASKKFIYVLGVDLGYSPDPSAFVLCAYSEFSRELFVVESFQQEKLTIEDIANLIKNYQRKYEGLRIVMDLGAQGKMIGNEIRSRYGIPVMAAEKNGKAGFIEIINSDFMAGYIKILPINRDLIDQLMQLIWDSESELRVEDDRFPNHLTDALLYAWRFCYNFNPKKEEERVLRGTNREIEQHWEREARELEAKLRNEQLDDDMLYG